MLDRTIAPPSGELFYSPFVEAKKFSKGQTPIYFLNAGEQPVIKLQLKFQSGIRHESNLGESWFVAKMIMEGTKYKTSNEISEAFQTLGAFTEIEPGFDDISIAVYGLKRNFEAVSKLLGEVLFEPTFPEKEIDTLKKIRLDELKINNSKADMIASKKIRESLFGLNHPYGKALQEKNILNIDRTKLVQYYQTKFFNGAEIFVSGDVDEALLSSISTCFSFDDVSTPSYEKWQNRDTNSIVVDKPDQIQTSIKLGWHIPNKTHPNYFDLSIANTFFGGYFGSRLMKNIREQKGYTYGISSYPIHLKLSSFLIISTDVKAEFGQATVDEVSKEIERLIDEPVSSEEIEMVVNYLAGSFNSSLSNPFTLMNKFIEIHKIGEDYNYYTRYFDSLKSFNETKLKQVINKYLEPNKMHKVLIGPEH